MGVIGAIVLLCIGIFFFGLWTLFWGVKERVQKIMPSKAVKDKIVLLDQGLQWVGFQTLHNNAENRVYIKNDYLSKLITECLDEGTLQEYINRQGYQIITTTRSDIPYSWLLCSATHCIGFDYR